MIVRPDPSHPSGKNSELTQDEFDKGFTVAMLTGPIAGVISVAGGESAYDVTADAIAVKEEHREELLTAIHRAHHAAGRFLDAPLPSE